MIMSTGRSRGYWSRSLLGGLFLFLLGLVTSRLFGLLGLRLIRLFSARGSLRGANGNVSFAEALESLGSNLLVVIVEERQLLLGILEPLVHLGAHLFGLLHFLGSDSTLVVSLENVTHLLVEELGDLREDLRVSRTRASGGIRLGLLRLITTGGLSRLLSILTFASGTLFGSLIAFSGLLSLASSRFLSFSRLGLIFSSRLRNLSKRGVDAVLATGQLSQLLLKESAEVRSEIIDHVDLLAEQDAVIRMGHDDLGEFDGGSSVEESGDNKQGSSHFFDFFSIPMITVPFKSGWHYWRCEQTEFMQIKK